jgi:signal transduction histidine kinase
MARRAIMSKLGPDFLNDIATISSIEAVPSILQVVCHSTGMGFAAVARVTEGRWIACSVLDQIDFGLKPGGELKVETTICHEIRQSRQGVVIDHVAEDPTYCGHHTPAMYGFQSYISLPIMLRDGSMFGTLCAIDPKPRRLKNQATIGMFKLFAELIAFHIDSTNRLATSEADLMNERETAELREQFIAVLGHDLRNPLASIVSGMRLLSKDPLKERSKELVALMQNSAMRMDELINNVLDLTRARLGGGFKLNCIVEDEMLPVLQEVVDELRVARPDRVIEMEANINEPINCDRGRIAQLFSNLVGNAVKHGDANAPVRISAETAEGALKLSVSNGGDPIPPFAIKRLFQPYVRGTGAGNPNGLGLGLYIASEIARAHGGMLTVTSSTAETRFTFQMPLR